MTLMSGNRYRNRLLEKILQECLIIISILNKIAFQHTTLLVLKSISYVIVIHAVTGRRRVTIARFDRNLF